MLIFDELKKNDPQLRWLAIIVASGMLMLLAGLWWMQIVSARDYMANLETQTIRTVRVPAVRGKILDRNGNVLAENRPSYNINLYLDELAPQFDAAITAETARVRNQLAQLIREQEKKLGRKLNSKEKNLFALDTNRKAFIRQQCRYAVVSNLVQQISRQLQYPLTLDFTNFDRHSAALPYQIARNLDPVRVARFEEQFSYSPGLDLEVQALRVYPHTNLAAHVLGYLRSDNSSVENEEAFFSYRMPDYSGVLGIEAGFDRELHGLAGSKSVLVNSVGFRQSETILTPANAGTNVVLTLNLEFQQGAERALQTAAVNYTGPPRGAAVILDVETGDVLAMASSPAFNPNYFVDRRSFPPDYYSRMQALKAEKNLATQENYQPGSIFKPIVALAALDRGLDPDAIYHVQPDPKDSSRGIFYYQSRSDSVHDTAPPGPYSFKLALIRSSNSYFIWAGLKVGIEEIVRIGQRLHLGETFRGTGPRSYLPTRQETGGNFPSWTQIHSHWYDGHSGQVCIGQGGVDVTPLQMTVVAAAIANGGKVLWPRLVDRIEPQDPTATEGATVFPKGQVRDNLGVKPRTLQILQEAMLDDTEAPGGTAYEAFRDWPYQKTMRICGKTGTSQRKNARGELETHITWFLSFAPYEKPRYAVVVMIEGGTSGGGTCAPVARKIYEAIVQSERGHAPRSNTVAQNR